MGRVSESEREKLFLTPTFFGKRKLFPLVCELGTVRKCNIQGIHCSRVTMDNNFKDIGIIEKDKHEGMGGRGGSW